ncbi:MAG: hypothetical protein M5U27_10035 [Gaiella sp.]|nr:hypothetical protein [Gaiella sp.]
MQLEVDLIETAREVNRERLAVVTALGAIDEPVGQAEVEQVGRAAFSQLSGSQKSRATRSRAATSSLGSGRGSMSVCPESWATMSTSRVVRLVRPTASSAEPPITTSSA